MIIQRGVQDKALVSDCSCNAKLITVYVSQVWFSAGKKRKKQRTFFSHTAGSYSLRTSVWEFPRLHGWCKVQFLFRHLPLLDMPHPATCEIYFFECIKLKRNYSLATMLLC